MGLHDYLAYASIAFFAINVVTFIIIKLAGRNVGAKKLVGFLDGVSDFANDVAKIDDENIQQFEATCLSENCPEAFSAGWETFKNARFGYPSEFFDKTKFVTTQDVKKHNKKAVITLSVFYFIAVALFGACIWLLKDETIKNNVIYYIAAILRFASVCLIPWLVMFSVSRKPTDKILPALERSMDLLDAKVQMQKHESYAIDVTKLDGVLNLISQIIDEEENKPIPSKKDQLEKAAAIEAEQDELDEDNVEPIDQPQNEDLEDKLDVGEVLDESMDDIRSEILFDEEDEIAYAQPVEATDDEIEDDVIETEESDKVEKYMDSPYAPVSYGYLPPEEDLISVEFKSPTLEVEQKPKKKPIDFNKFNGVLNQIIDGGYSRALYLKVAKLMLVAFEKFKEPEQKAELKQSIRRLIQAYRLAA